MKGNRSIIFHWTFRKRNDAPLNSDRGWRNTGVISVASIIAKLKTNGQTGRSDIENCAKGREYPRESTVSVLLANSYSVCSPVNVQKILCFDAQRTDIYIYTYRRTFNCEIGARCSVMLAKLTDARTWQPRKFELSTLAPVRTLGFNL